MSRRYVMSSPAPGEAFQRLENESVQRVYRTLRIDGVDYDVVWDGGPGLTRHTGGSTLKAAVGTLAVGRVD